MDIETFEETVSPIVKTTLSLVTGVGVGRIVGGIVSMTAPQTTLYGKVTVGVAKLGLCSVIGAAIEKNNSTTIDKTIAAVKQHYETAPITAD